MSLWSRLVNVIRGDRLIAEIDEELESHIAEAIAHGRDAEEARRAFGGSLRQREASRDIKRMAWLADCPMDLRRAVRAVWRHRALTSAVVGSLALDGRQVASKLVLAVRLGRRLGARRMWRPSSLRETTL